MALGFYGMRRKGYSIGPTTGVGRGVCFNELN